MSPQGDALFSVRLFEDMTDAEAVARLDAEVWQATLPDHHVTLGPEWHAIGERDVLWTEWESVKNGSRAADAFVIIPQGVLRLSLLCEPPIFVQRRATFEQIVGSLHE